MPLEVLFRIYTFAAASYNTDPPPTLLLLLDCHLQERLDAFDADAFGAPSKMAFGELLDRYFGTRKALAGDTDRRASQSARATRTSATSAASRPMRRS